MHRRPKIFSTGLLLTVWLLASCGQYDIKVNDKLVYTPAKLIQVQGISDPALANCLEQAIADKLITSTAQLKELNCSNAGIETLDGLASYYGLEQLKLSSNQIRNLVELEKLTRLVNLWLDDNAVIDIVPLSQLPQLALLDVSENSRMQCPSPGLFASSVSVLIDSRCKNP